MNKCPCGSDESYDLCCRVYISGSKAAPTPEALMRSRYAAYTLANIEYVQQTMQGEAAEGFDSKQAFEWASNATWEGLTVCEAPEIKGDEGFVEFIARFKYNGKSESIHELSRFERIDGCWFYVSGEHKT